MSMQQKEYDIFISHSSRDVAFSDKLYNLLTKAGFTIWYDETSLLANEYLTTDLSAHIAASRTLIVILSQSSCNSRWVKNEYDYAIKLCDKQELNIIPVVIDDCVLPPFYESSKWLDCKQGLTPTTFFMILAALYGTAENTRQEKDIYVSYPWRRAERPLVDKVFSSLLRMRYRLIGDASDQVTYNVDDRISRIMSSCGGFVGILPYRSSSRLLTSHYILDEIAQASQQGLPGLVIADSRIENVESMTSYPVIKVDNVEDDDELDKIREGIYELKPIRPQTPHVFFATSFSGNQTAINNLIRNLSGFVTATVCVLGEDINLGNLQQQIIDRIRSSYVMIADITDERFNTCIEAGIARGAGVHLYLIAKAPRKTPPFMFRDMNVRYYEDDCERLAVIHKILRPYRRAVL